jgi:aspartyl-tRNA(Asn)/glutamyl-tRNA(Gln) amidotransferase subunit C
MSLTNEQVHRIAHLARIELAAGEDARIRDQLNGIFSLIEQMQAVDTRGVEPMSHAVDLSQRLREDRVSESDLHEKFQHISPDVEAGLYLVPRVIE